MTDKEYLQYSPMLIKIANRFKNNPYGIDIEDIMQIGSIGMIRAFDTYQEDKEIKFSTYVYNCISWSIRREFDNLKRIMKQYTFTSLDHEIDEENSMYEIIPNSSVNVEYEVIEDMTLQEYIQEFRNILTLTKANIFIDRYVNELQIKDIAAKYNKKESTINSVIRQSKHELIRKSFRIRNEYERYINQKKKSEDIYINPSNIEAGNGYYNSRLEFIKRLEEEQIQRDREFMSYYRG
ncbi:sigma-70 family RNA polymerase sigma factor [Terrisporobacter mayombei]|uniref:RNA polymerase sigma factor FliA n=1 Tax=Terrisporobacter mayombei TaxID=1541 RepID=A0ABY9Q4L4_9FIRM|nr:sigma-70 family RNA polymerase sigma factor [Terrisporobacter mayombei]MCC3868926.1 sigma-70 family RNA polymerase sigma factor [Terrisporobacter mayombei]WMT82940.1 RNA polymerase sigma factor FliA [Terrisporobacter mayombei]